MADCGDPPGMENADVSYTTKLYGDVVEYNCFHGYRYNSDNTSSRAYVCNASMVDGYVEPFWHNLDLDNDGCKGRTMLIQLINFTDYKYYTSINFNIYFKSILSILIILCQKLE